MTPIEALRAATSVAATVLGRDAELGRLDTGKIADLIAVAGSPATRIQDLQDILLVIQSGQVVHSNSPTSG